MTDANGMEVLCLWHIYLTDNDNLDWRDLGIERIVLSTRTRTTNVVCGDDAVADCFSVLGIQGGNVDVSFAV